MTRIDYLNEVFGLTMWKDLQVVFIDEAKKVKTKSDLIEFANKWVFFMVFDSSIHTIKNRSKDMRDILSQENLQDYITLFKIDSSIYGSIKKEYEKKVKENLEVSSDNNSNHSKFTEDNIKMLINNIDNGITLSKSNMSKLKDEIFYQKLFVLALATGRRQIELLKTLNFKKKKELAVYEGLSKKRNDDETTCEAPILIDIFLAKKYLNDIREYLKDYNIENLTADQINSKFNGRIGNAIKRYIGNYNFHYFRSCYAHTCYEKNKIKIEKSLYFTQILGHKDVILPAHAYTSK